MYSFTKKYFWHIRSVVLNYLKAKYTIVFVYNFYAALQAFSKKVIEAVCIVSLIAASYIGSESNFFLQFLVQNIS